LRQISRTSVIFCEIFKIVYFVYVGRSWRYYTKSL